MSIKVDEQTEVTISANTNIYEIDQWLVEHMSRDQYSILGQEGGRLLFSFRDANQAMLFKLTFGG